MKGDDPILTQERPFSKFNKLILQFKDHNDRDVKIGKYE